MKNYYKAWAFVPLVVWVILFHGIGFGIGAATGAFNQSISEAMPPYMYWILVVCFAAAFYCLFVLIWWACKMNSLATNDLFVKLIIFISFNFIAYWLIAQAIAVNAQNKQQQIKDNNRYKQKVAVQISEDVFIPDWEKQLIAEKAAKKALKKQRQVETIEVQQIEVDSEIKTDRLLIRNFVKYLMYQVFQENPGITNTYQITKLIETKAHDQGLKQQLVKQYAQEFHQWNNIEDFAGVDSNSVEALLNQVDGDEIMVAHKQDRVDITIEVQVKIEKQQKQ
ncbi:hypothetical protein [Mesoplasma seiffertii]|uniref:hypothetical protein n=1 Tax=Mesoplasma seiffertii TaxID=28224 RepID=UPI00047BDF26|nr:hypothetical protein [Mesoplasma seiffertii]